MDLSILQCVTFYLDESDEIASEHITFPVVLGEERVAPETSYIVRFYPIGEKRIPTEDTMSRRTATGVQCSQQECRQLKQHT